MISVELLPGHFVEGGFLIVPFGHPSLEGAAVLHGIDYPAASARPPPGVGKAERDVGAELRGYLFQERLQYRLGVFGGVAQGTPGPRGLLDPAPRFLLNPRAIPRFARHLRWNFLGRENDFALQGIYFAERPMLSVGVSADYQPDAIAGSAAPADYLALAADVFTEIPWSADVELVMQAIVYRHAQGDAQPDNNGYGFFFEGGLRYRMVSVVTMEEYFHGETAGHDALAVHGGVNWWVRGHNMNLKADFAWTRSGDLARTPDGYAGTLQTQLFY